MLSCLCLQRLAEILAANEDAALEWVWALDRIDAALANEAAVHELP